MAEKYLHRLGGRGIMQKYKLWQGARSGKTGGAQVHLQAGEDKGMDSQRKWAFCRMEMVVVGVCAVLVLLVTLPGLTGAREAGKRAVCLANLKTLGAAALLYARDYEDKIPGWGIEFDEIDIQGDPNADWFTKTTDSLTKAFEYGYIWEYVQIRSPYTCPSLTNKINPKPRINSSPHPGNIWGWPGGEKTKNPPGPMWSYVVNAQAGKCMNDPLWRANPELVQPSPQTVMMLFEQDCYDYAAFDNSVCLFNPTYDTRTNAEDSLGRYHKVSGIGQLGVSTFNNRKGSGNIVFFDGHVDDMSIEEFIIKRSTAQGTIELCGGYEGFTWPGFE